MAQRITTLQSNLIARASIDSMQTSSSFSFEKMSDTETTATLDTMATAAGMRISAGAMPDSIDPSLSTHLSLGQLTALPAAAKHRMQIAGIEGNTSPFASNAYRVSLSKSKTLIRFVEGKIGINELLEETVETHLSHHFQQTGTTPQWAAEHLRKAQTLLRQSGAIKHNLISPEGDVTHMQVIEAMGTLAQADFLHRVDSLTLPEFIKDFIKWARNIISQAAHLANLGKTIRELDAAGKLDKTFTQAIYDAAGITQAFWKDAAIDSTHLALARIATAAIAPHHTTLTTSQDITNGAYKAWLNTTTLKDEDTTTDIQASFSVTAQDKDGNTLHPDTFLTKKDGNIDWLHLKKGKEWKPIRLQIGKDSSPHKGYGLTHIVASRNLDSTSFWDNMSPESYIEDICSNASELYEMSGRELVVKGKRPSQWLFIQLQKEGNYYSVVTAHPVKSNKKPIGKKVPLRSAPASPVNVDQNNFPDSNANDTTPQSATAVWNSKPNLPNSSNIVNIKDVTCRFDDGSSIQASFSITPQDNEQWKNSLNNYLTNGATDRAMPIKMSSAPNVLQAMGFSDRDIVITPSTLDKVMGEKHSLDQTHVEQLAAAIHDPIMVVDSATQAGALVVLTEVKVDGSNVIAAIHLDKQERGGFYHVVASAYDGVSPWMIINQIKAGKLRYIDKKSALAWARENRLQLPALSSQKGKPTILTPEDVVKWKNAHDTKSIPLSDFLKGDLTDTTSFSVIGTHSKNWDNIKHKAFTGRDDGMLRVELDASQAQITPDTAQRIQRRLAKDRTEKKVRFTLKNILHYPALYQAYPKLADMAITLTSLGARGTRAWYSPKTKKITINTLNFDHSNYDTAALRSTLLHEIQHAIQHIEGYTYGSSSNNEDEYLRAGGEIEARNVQQRREYTESQRQEQAFNDTLEYKGEALPSISPPPIDIPFNLVSGEFDKSWTSLRRSSNKAHSNFIKLITEALNKDAERLTRYNELAEDERADMAITLMRATNIAKTATMYMPKGYRIGLKPYLDWMEVFADIAHNGELDWAAQAPAQFWSKRMQDHLKKVQKDFLTATEDTDQALALLKNYGETRLYMLINKLILRVSNNLEEYGKTKLHDQIAELLNSTKPKPNKNGQYTTGTLSVESRRELERITQLIHLEPETLENKLDELNGKILSLQENAEDQAQELIDDYQAQKLELEVYGAISTKSIDELDRLHTALTRHIRGEKSAWADTIEARKQKQKDAAATIIKGIESRHGDIDSNAITRAKEDKQTNGKKKSLPRRIWHAMSSLESLPQLLKTLEREPESKAYASDLRHRLSTAGANLNIASQHLNTQFRQYLLSAYNLPQNTSNFTLDKILADLKKTQKTGIHLPVYTKRKLSLPIHIAALLANKQTAKLADLKTQLARQQELLEAQYAQEQATSTGSLETDKTLKSIQEQLNAINAEYTQADLDEMQQWLAEETTSHNTKTTLWQQKLGKKPTPKEKLEHSYTQLDKVETNELELTKDAALYIILLHEQTQYTALVEEKGFHPKHIETLKNYVGTEALTLAYKMRRHLAQQGERIAKVYEATTGIPFPRIPNYFAARFRMENKLIDFTIEDMLAGMQGNSAGAGNKFLTTRKNHNQNLDLSIGATNTFLDAVETSEHWMQTHSITTDLRALLTSKNVVNALRINYGRQPIEQLKQWLQCLQNTGRIDGNIKTNTSILHAQLYSSGSIGILAYKIESMIRQLSGIANLWAGDDSLSTLDWLKAMAHLKNNPMSLSKMLKSPYIKSRAIRTTDLTAIKAARRNNDYKYTELDRLADIGMIPMGILDAYPQAIPATLLYNANYRKAQESTLPDGTTRTDKECDTIAWSAVHAAFSNAAQPTNAWEKSHASHELGAGFGRAAFFMMSENINKLGLIYSLTKQRKYTKATAVWLTYGALNSTIGAILDAMRDDPEDWDERKLSGYLYATLFGMFSGIPVLSEGLEYLLHQAGADIYLGSSGRGIIDASAFSRSLKNIITKSDEYTYEDWIKESIKLSRTLGIIGGAMGNTTGSALLLTAGLSNPVKTTINAKNSALLNEKEE